LHLAVSPVVGSKCSITKHRVHFTDTPTVVESTLARRSGRSVRALWRVDTETAVRGGGMREAHVHRRYIPAPSRVPVRILRTNHVAAREGLVTGCAHVGVVALALGVRPPPVEPLKIVIPVAHWHSGVIGVDAIVGTASNPITTIISLTYRVRAVMRVIPAIKGRCKSKRLCKSIRLCLRTFGCPHY
jgi:hypothetical protein